MNIIGFAKGATELAVSMGSSTIVSHIVKNNLPTDLKLYQKVTVTFGSIAIAGLVGDQASKYSVAQIDSAMKSYYEAKAAFEAGRKNNEK